MNTIKTYVGRLTRKLEAPVQRGHPLGVTATHVSTPFQNELQTLLHVKTVLLCLIGELWEDSQEKGKKRKERKPAQLKYIQTRTHT